MSRIDRQGRWAGASGSGHTRYTLRNTEIDRSRTGFKKEPGFQSMGMDEHSDGFRQDAEVVFCFSRLDVR